MSRVIPVPEHIKALIFDCDGTLVDSMPLHLKGWQYALQKYGDEWDYDFLFSCRGMFDEDIVTLYNSKYSTSLNPGAVLQLKQSYVDNHMADLKPIEPVVEVALKYKNVLPMAVASGGTKENVHAELEVTGIAGLFDFILTADDGFKPKPAPDLFLQAAGLMNVQPELCQVFEDGELGIQVAEKAGMTSIDIKDFI